MKSNARRGSGGTPFATMGVMTISATTRR